MAMVSSIQPKDWSFHFSGNGDDDDDACDIQGWELVKRHFSVVAWTLWLCWRGHCLNVLLFRLCVFPWWSLLINIKGKWRWLHSGEDATSLIEHLWAPGRWESGYEMMAILMRTRIMSWLMTMVLSWTPLGTWKVRKSNGDEMWQPLTNGYYVINTIIAL